MVGSSRLAAMTSKRVRSGSSLCNDKSPTTSSRFRLCFSILARWALAGRESLRKSASRNSSAAAQFSQMRRPL
ncbi:MAG: hypothetical protein BWY13_00076 [Euryarchaeota archaeon ADurb.Bin190]|nr:MAG: hypothetical protein BWY13_00076 [Euryarchaeota archaeon ADurb.Bin190]